MIIEDVYWILTGISFKMKFVELEVLAHIAGWHMRGFSLTCMSVQIQGTILNRCVDNADGKWGQLWEYVSRSMKVYALGNLRVGYSAMIVLLGIIIRDLFLDPDVFCKQMRLYQYQATRWVCELLLASCKFMEVNEELLHMTATRGDLICAISRISETGEFSRTSSEHGSSVTMIHPVLCTLKCCQMTPLGSLILIRSLRKSFGCRIRWRVASWHQLLMSPKRGRLE